MSQSVLLFNQIYPYLDKDQIFVLIDKNGEATSYDPSGNRTAEVYDLFNRRVLGITAYKFDMYCEESYVAIKLDYNKQDMLIM